MGIFDDLSKTISYGIDRAKFETDKFQRTSRLQAELSNLQRNLDQHMMDLGSKAYDLYKANQIPSPSVAELVEAIDALHAQVVVKEDELKHARTEGFQPEQLVVPPLYQAIHIEEESATPAHSPTTEPLLSPSTSKTIVLQPKTCPVCNFEMLPRAIFCPNCGYRVGS